jgi:hypothetical protein
MEHYSVLKRKMPSSHEKTRKKLTRISQSGRSQSEESAYGLSPPVMTFWKRQNKGVGKKIRVSKG